MKHNRFSFSSQACIAASLYSKATIFSCDCPAYMVVISMSRKSKLVKRFLSTPKDFTWQELISLLSSFGYELQATGKTGGSRVRFIHKRLPPIILHKPHPAKILKRYQIQQIIEIFKNEGLL